MEKIEWTQKHTKETFPDRVVTGGPGIQTSGEGRASSGPDLWGPLPKQLWERGLNPTGWRLIWRLAEKAGGKRRIWVGTHGSRRLFLQADIWREEGYENPSLESRDR